MGCSLKASAEMHETITRLDQEARRNDDLKHYYMLVHSLKRKISSSRIDKKSLENEAASILSDGAMHNDTFINKMQRFRRQILLIKAEQEMFENTLKGYIEEIKSLTKVMGAGRMEIEDVAKSGYYSSDK